MKSLALFALVSLVANFASANQIRTVCTPVKKSGYFVKVLKNPGRPAEITLYRSSKDDLQTVVQITGKDVFELYEGLFQLNFTAGHHNTVIKLASDYDLFGGDTSVEGEETWNGKLFLSANIADVAGSDKDIAVDVTCSYDI